MHATIMEIKYHKTSTFAIKNTRTIQDRMIQCCTNWEVYHRVLY